MIEILTLLGNKVKSKALPRQRRDNSTNKFQFISFLKFESHYK
jgi:hypothetical protein